MNAQLQPAATPTGMPNPLGIHGFEFVEFAAPDAAGLHILFRSMGFAAIARHRSRAITLYRQGGVNFLVNEEPDSFASAFAAQHGPCACGFDHLVPCGFISGIATEDVARGGRSPVNPHAEQRDPGEELHHGELAHRLFQTLLGFGELPAESPELRAGG